MSIVVMPSRKPSPPPVISIASEVRRIDAPTPLRSGEGVRRRGNMKQGRALEALGHAVEYLVDSRLFILDQASLQSEGEAVQIMMRLSRAVFAECPEVISLRRRLRMWVAERFANPVEMNRIR